MNGLEKVKRVGAPETRGNFKRCTMSVNTQQIYYFIANIKTIAKINPLIPPIAIRRLRLTFFCSLVLSCLVCIKVSVIALF